MEYFFGIGISTSSTFGMSLGLILAVVLGGAIGLEREIHGHPAGLRTHILVCVGSALMTLVSVHISPQGDPGRIAAQIVTGIGFLGAGAIMQGGRTVRGLTTAASIWTTAGIGIAVGAGPHFSELAVIATTLVLLTLWLMNRLENRIAEMSSQVASIDIEFPGGKAKAQLLFKKIEQYGIVIISKNRHHPSYIGNMSFHLRMRVPDDLEANALIRELNEIGAVVKMHAQVISPSDE